jgi:two-component system cell cycle sensor histidine kinase/response regulator CckA
VIAHPWVPWKGEIRRPFSITLGRDPMHPPQPHPIPGSARDMPQDDLAELYRLASIIESSEDAIVTQDLHGKILTWNRGASAIYGYAAEQMIGRSIQLLAGQDRLNEEEAILARIRAGQRVQHFETVRIKKNGAPVHVSLTISPILDETTRVVVGATHIARDISERKRMEAANSQLAAVVESSEDAIITKDLSGTILTWNDAAERVYGYPAAEAIGQKMLLLFPPDRVSEEAEILAKIRRGERVSHFETTRIRKGGISIDISLTISPMRDRGGNVVGVSHIARDITARKNFERQLQQTQRLESLGVLAGGVAHDFNNLLVGIMGNTSVAMETISTNNPAKGMLKDVLAASETAASLTRQLLAYAGKGRFVIEALDLSDLVVQISTLLQSSISKNVSIRHELAELLPCIEADASQMQQLIMNLVINGAEAIGTERSGTVLVATGTQRVDEHYISTTLAPADVGPGDYVILEVHDSGIGMSAETISRIFDPFFTTKFTGRGLGLAAVMGIVRGHKGAIKVYSTPGKGTTFKVLFPATDAPKPAAKASMQTAQPQDGATILVVDDEQIVRRTAKMMLERHGHTVIVAENGKEGLDLYRVLGEKIGLVLLDMTMPVMGGEETFRELKAISPDVRVILSSGYNEVEAVRRFAGKGLAGFVQKPYSSAVLLAKVENILTGRQHHRKLHDPK